MTAPQFLESLTNIPKLDYMHAKKAANPAFFLKRIKWLVEQMPGLSNFLKNTNFVHITGTSGKGTTGAILQSILACAGYKTGFYNSPHVKEVYERMRVIDKPKRLICSQDYSREPQRGGRLVLGAYQPQRQITIPSKTFAWLTQFIKPYLEKSILHSPYGLPSYFEILLTIGLLHFKKQKCDYVILEAGCGGRWDATNIIPQNKLAIITNIAYDHEHLIGPKLTDIASEKAGIIKKKSKVLVGPSVKGKVLQVIKKEAQKQNARLTSLKQKDIISLFHCFIVADYHQQDNNGAMEQWSNEIIAIASAQILGISDKAIQQGIKNYIPLSGRLEIIKKKPLIIFDGAHNPDKIKFLIQQFSNRAIEQYNNKILIFASCDTKNWRLMLKLLMPYFDKIYLTRHTVLQRKTADLKKMYKYVKKTLKTATWSDKLTRSHVKIFIDPGDALKQALLEAIKDDLILATGSLYLVGYLKSKVKSQK
jgi:dihydrofolate synthase/folylpolyglutamate synthase